MSSSQSKRGVRNFYSAARRTFFVGMSWFFFAPLLGCDFGDEPQMISRSDLLEKIKIGEAVRVSNLVSKTVETICVLYPYQDLVSESMPHANKINAHLKVTNYIADEGHWAFVFVENDAVVVSKYKRSEKLDILASNEIQATRIESLPKGFEPINCVAFADASIAKIETRNRVFLTLGEIK